MSEKSFKQHHAMDKEPLWFTSLCMGWLQTIYLLNLKNEKPRTTKGTLRTNSMFHYRALTITKIALPIAAQSYGTVFLPT